MDTSEKDRKKRCADTACTEMMSDDPSCSQVPFCGVCQRAIDKVCTVGRTLKAGTTVNLTFQIDKIDS